MSAKIQRWVDLLAALLRRRYPATFEELAQDVPGYQDPGQQPEARRRMFERDKDELRRFGVPIVTHQSEEHEAGYQLRARDFYLPYLHLLEEGRPRPLETPTDRDGYRALPILAFEPDELAAISELAERLPALGVPSILEDARAALRKLGAVPIPSGGDPVPARTVGVTFDLLNDALERRKTVSFTYRSLNSDRHGTRQAHPYGLFFLGHHWYLAAVEAGDTVVKNFRLSRMEDVALNTRQPGTPDYAIPEGFQLREHARSRQAWELGSADAFEAEVEVVRANGATQAVLRVGEPVPGHEHRRRFQVRRGDTFARWVLGFAGAVRPLAPPALVARCQELARETLARYEGGAA